MKIICLTFSIDGCRLVSNNLPYAIRIQGAFPFLKVRSVPKQTHPYPPLNDVINRSQTIFELQKVQGTLVGFGLPQYFNNVNTIGYHFHFLTSDRAYGGHLIDGEFINTRVEIETLLNWQISLPNHSSFAQVKLD